MHDVGIPGTVMVSLNKLSVPSNEILFSIKYKDTLLILSEIVS